MVAANLNYMYMLLSQLTCHEMRTEMSTYTEYGGQEAGPVQSLH